MSQARIMYDMTVRQVREGLEEMKTVIVPIGVVEQHGYHLPLSVDIHNAVEIARGASDETGCFVAPPTHYNFSGGTLPGTINLSPQVFSLVLTDICRSLSVQGFKNIILLMGHGGTEAGRAVSDAAENLQRLDPRMAGTAIAVVPFWELSPTYMKSFEEKDFHAGRYETSLMLYWKPELVRMDEARLDSPEMVQMMQADQDAFLVKHKDVDNKFVIPRLAQHPGIEVGVMGNYNGASAEFGQEIAMECIGALADIVRQMERENGVR
ncbi:MAG: creatininase family protein [bacterium]|nr:creatininase family protein [bacterium]